MSGRPKKLVHDHQLKIIEKMASKGCSEGTIAKALGMSHPTFIDRKKDQPEVKEALARGLAIEHDQLVGVLFDSAVNKHNITAAMFLLKTRHGYLEGQPLEGTGTKVNVNITLPGALSPSDYGKLIDGESSPEPSTKPRRKLTRK